MPRPLVRPIRLALAAALLSGPAAADPGDGLNMASIAGLIQAWTARGAATPAELTLAVHRLLQAPPGPSTAEDSEAGRTELGATDPATGCRPLVQTAPIRGRSVTLVASACPGPAGWALMDLRDRDAPPPAHPPPTPAAAARPEPVRVRPLAVAPAWQGGLFEIPAPPGVAPARPRARYCAVAITFGDGATLQVRQDADTIAVIVIPPPAHAPLDPARRALYAAFDRNAAVKLSAAADGDRTVVSAPATDHAFLKNFIAGSILEIGTDPAHLLGPYSLKGSQQSLEAMAQCAAQAFAPQRPPRG